MLAQRAFKVSEVATEAGLPRSRAYELIRSLVRFGLCTEVAGSGVARFRAVPPNEAIGRLEASKAEQARRRDLALNGLVQALAHRSGPSPGAGEEPVEMLRRREQLLSVMAAEVCQATEEVLTIVNTSWEPTDCRGMRDRLAAGVRFRTIFDRDSLDHEPHREWVAALAGEPGFEAHGLGQTLRDAFERIWAHGVPFDQALEAGDTPALVGATTSARGPSPGPRASNGRSAAFG
jgi:hypothetical protein